eukprot:998280-Rhodomonas_salina.1
MTGSAAAHKTRGFATGLAAAAAGALLRLLLGPHPDPEAVHAKHHAVAALPRGDDALSSRPICLF